MQYKVYCLLKNANVDSTDRVVRVKVIADCINEALYKAKERFNQKLRQKKYSIFMYETVK
ncbi:MAG: hypothetical protein E7360_04310 [Clostridiales bacterium]|nr:hypothetical protein [Clostridiales bacterium]